MTGEIIAGLVAAAFFLVVGLNSWKDRDEFTFASLLLSGIIVAVVVANVA